MSRSFCLWRSFPAGLAETACARATSVPPNKCAITVTSKLGNTEKLLILETRCLNLVARCGERMAQAGVCEMESVARRPET